MMSIHSLLSSYSMLRFCHYFKCYSGTQFKAVLKYQTIRYCLKFPDAVCVFLKQRFLFIRHGDTEFFFIPAASCTPWKMRRTQSARYCRTTNLPKSSSDTLLIDQFVKNDFLRTVADIVHTTHPFHLVGCFERFGHALLLCHSVNDGFHTLIAGLVDFGQMREQRTLHHIIGVEDFSVLDRKSTRLNSSH